MDLTKPYKFISFGDIHGPKPYQFMGVRWAFISQTPVLNEDSSLAAPPLVSSLFPGLDWRYWDPSYT